VFNKKNWKLEFILITFNSIVLLLSNYKILFMDTKKITKIMKALSNPNRLELFMEISKSNETSYEGEECYIYNIMEKFNINAPTISHHLKELSNADLITTERKGKYLVARINEQTLREISDVINFK
jgi:DNA-binding transcriptional ArsR family regulator